MQQLLRILARAAVIVVIASLFPAKLHASDWWLDASYAQPLRWNVGAFLFFDQDDVQNRNGGRRIIVGGNVGPNGMQAWGGKLLDLPGGGSNWRPLDLRAVITRTWDNPRGAAASAQTPESPHDLWEHMIAAKGGHERLQSVRTFAWMATLVTPSHRNWSAGPSMVYVAAPPDHLWIYESGYAETWRGRGLSSPGRGIPATLTSLEAWQLACFLETSVVRPTPVSVEPSAEDARVVILEATSGHLKVRYIVDRESYIVRQVTLSRRTDDPESGFSRFIDERPFTLEGTETVGGIQMPRWIRTGDDVRDLRFLINPELDEALFEPWSNRPARSDAWGEFLLADHQAAKRLADLRPGLPPPSRKPDFLVGGGYDGTLRESGRAAAIFAADDWLRNVTRLPAVYAEATGGPGGVRVTAGAMALQPVFSLLQVVGASVGATVTWTSGAPRETSPHSTYVGGQAGILLFFVKVDLGVDVRVRGGEPNAPHAAGFRWSVGYQVPIPW